MMCFECIDAPEATPTLLIVALVVWLLLAAKLGGWPDDD